MPKVIQVPCYTFAHGSLGRQLGSYVDINTIEKAVAGALAGYDVREAYLYGSFARGEQTADSDIDLRFLCGRDIDFIQLNDIQRNLERMLGRKVDIATAPPDQMRRSFYERIRKDEVKLHAAV